MKQVLIIAVAVIIAAVDFCDVLLSESSITGRSDVGKIESEK